MTRALLIVAALAILATSFVSLTLCGILAAIAYPSYTQYVIDSRRGLAQGCVITRINGRACLLL